MELYQDPVEEKKEIDRLTEKYTNLRNFYRRSVVLRDALLRLKDNEDFKQVILEEFTVNYALEQIKNATNPKGSALTPDEVEALMDSSRASGHLSHYFERIISEGNKYEELYNNLERDEFVEKEAVRQIYAETREYNNYD